MVTLILKKGQPRVARLKSTQPWNVSISLEPPRHAQEAGGWWYKSVINQTFRICPRKSTISQRIPGKSLEDGRVRVQFAMKLIKTWMSESMPGVTGACKAVIGIVCSRSSRVGKGGFGKAIRLFGEQN